eukprot:s392_g39.t1
MNGVHGEVPQTGMKPTCWQTICYDWRDLFKLGGTNVEGPPDLLHALAKLTPHRVVAMFSSGPKAVAQERAFQVPACQRLHRGDPTDAEELARLGGVAPQRATPLGLAHERRGKLLRKLFTWKFLQVRSCYLYELLMAYSKKLAYQPSKSGKIQACHDQAQPAQQKRDAEALRARRNGSHLCHPLRRAAVPRDPEPDRWNWGDLESDPKLCQSPAGDANTLRIWPSNAETEAPRPQSENPHPATGPVLLAPCGKRGDSRTELGRVMAGDKRKAEGSCHSGEGTVGFY